MSIQSILAEHEPSVLMDQPLLTAKELTEFYSNDKQSKLYPIQECEDAYRENEE